MALSVSDVRRANKEYYSSEYAKLKGFLICLRTVLPIMVIVISQLLVWGIKHMILKKIYDIEAGTQALDKQETQDWINQQIQSHQLDQVTVTMVITVTAMVGIGIYYHFFKNNYESYKKKGKVLITLALCIIIEVLALFSYFLITPLGINDICQFSGSIVTEFIIVLSIVGAILPLELKAPVPPIKQGNTIKKTVFKCIFKCINWLTDWILKQL